MKIKIIKCSDILQWYCKHIGDEFVVQNITVDRGCRYFWVREGDVYDCLNWVREQDLEIVEE